MTDDEIRSALLAARGGFAPVTKDHHLVLSRDRVAAENRDEVDRWVQAVNGEIHTEPGYESRPLGTARWQHGPSTAPSQWYIVPAAVLGL